MVLLCSSVVYNSWFHHAQTHSVNHSVYEEDGGGNGGNEEEAEEEEDGKGEEETPSVSIYTAVSFFSCQALKTSVHSQTNPQKKKRKL